jgi:hypothetical protein
VEVGIGAHLPDRGRIKSPAKTVLVAFDQINIRTKNTENKAVFDDPFGSRFTSCGQATKVVGDV